MVAAARTGTRDRGSWNECLVLYSLCDQFKVSPDLASLVDRTLSGGDRLVKVASLVVHSCNPGTDTVSTMTLDGWYTPSTQTEPDLVRVGPAARGSSRPLGTRAWHDVLPCQVLTYLRGC